MSTKPFSNPRKRKSLMLDEENVRVSFSWEVKLQYVAENVTRGRGSVHCQHERRLHVGLHLVILSVRTVFNRIFSNEVFRKGRTLIHISKKLNRLTSSVQGDDLASKCVNGRRRHSSNSTVNFHPFKYPPRWRSNAPVGEEITLISLFGSLVCCYHQLSTNSILVAEWK